MASSGAGRPPGRLSAWFPTYPKPDSSNGARAAGSGAGGDRRPPL